MNVPLTLVVSMDAWDRLAVMFATSGPPVMPVHAMVELPAVFVGMA
jgi:hypothetical protein